ncbi:hypothetical protein APHMUC_0285 [Anaplasma phagocytophilum str. ApMUC09]|uniref:Uncharacterized protein n=1 Tax=Anaplasma phagocytophilum str. ApMUC09 TaxID=1359152 RepID=A0A0F3N953_ANAPH|nr:hypothetical protein APHMUC_0285 [Anaplasma phagocytophilum str. ApMUC09]SCV62941.1 hypothetical protein ANAPH2_00474 [Anaplasma phagocytophilum]
MFFNMYYNAYSWHHIGLSKTLFLYPLKEKMLLVGMIVKLQNKYKYLTLGYKRERVEIITIDICCEI